MQPTNQVIRSDKVIVFSPAASVLGPYSALVVKGQIRLKATTSGDLDRLPEYEIPAGIDPLKALLDTRTEEDR